MAFTRTGMHVLESESWRIVKRRAEAMGSAFCAAVLVQRNVDNPSLTAGLSIGALC